MDHSFLVLIGAFTNWLFKGEYSIKSFKENVLMKEGYGENEFWVGIITLIVVIVILAGIASFIEI